MGYIISRAEEKQQVINLKTIVAKRAKRLVYGGGISNNSKSEQTKERLQFLYDKNSLYDLLNSAEGELSSRTDGAQYIALVPTTYMGEPFIRFDFVDMNTSFFQSAQNGEVIFGRETTRKVEYGDAAFIITRVWTLKGMKTKVDLLAGNTLYAPEEISVGKFNSMVPDFLREPEEWDYSELGRIPIITFTNTPSTYANDEGDMSAIEGLQQLLDSTTFAAFKELRNNSTRVISQGANNRIKRNADGTPNFDAYDEDIFLSLGKQKNIDPTAAQNLIEILQGDPKTESFSGFIDYIVDLSLEMSGYASKGSADANRTSAGTIFTKSGDVETTKFKKSEREKTLKDMISLIQEIDERWNGIIHEDKDATITIKDNKIFDDQFKLDKLQLGTQLGLYTLEEQIALLKDTEDKEFIAQNIDELKEQNVSPIETKIENKNDNNM